MSELLKRFISKDSIRYRYFHLVNPNDKQEPFTEKEDKKLMMLVENFGMKWPEFVRKFFPHRSSE